MTASDCFNCAECLNEDLKGGRVVVCMVGGAFPLKHSTDRMHCHEPIDKQTAYLHFRSPTIPSLMMLKALSILLVLAITTLVKTATVDQRCIDACSDYSGALNFCRDSFDWKPGQKDAGLATEYVKCICEGSRGDSTLGADVMGQSINTCLGCSITPDVIRNNLNTLNQLCAGIAGGSVDDKDVLAYAPFGYSVLTWNADGQPNAQAPA